MKKQYWSAMEVADVVVSIVMIVVCMNGEVVSSSSAAAAAKQPFPAMFVFGDSLIDSGNNNYLRSWAKANYVPYGIDFYQRTPTGRFCNGKSIVDFLGDLIGLPLLPTSEASFRGADIDRGVNYASAAAGILDESGQLLGERFNLRQQVENFRSTVEQLKKQINKTKMEEYLAKSLIVMNLGSNDYINNYLIPSFYNSSSNYNPLQYARLLITQYTINIMEVHNLGARKFLLAAIGPLGCMPNQLATRLAPPGKCVSFVNDMVEAFNKGLLSLVHQLNTNHTTSTFVFANTYAAFTDILNNPDYYGFSVTDRGCCGIGRNKGQITCLPFSIPCLNRDEYIFWDAYHPTQAFNQIIAEKAFNGGLTVCYPMNVKQMAQV
ncbi:hypothetical protein Ddye_009483 [Dipteronia dyeriana]|uniref:GDSL esterase/lipase n=1 Tax=Dipteronia dyeriana TaxID=168575 RepID=A0AAD9XBF8_9ROSI|nr:hypothetical protein Ddye_009483 [Dipteronia dyeriana]